MDWLIRNAHWIVPTAWITADVIVRATPWEWDNIIYDGARTIYKRLRRKKK